jgi:hypothetical protein
MNKNSLPTMGNHEILSLFADIIEELGRRGLTRSKNNPVADYAEHLVCKAFSLTSAEKSTKGYDATDSTGKKYEIKSRRKSPRSNPTRFSAIRDLQHRHFDFLVAVLFSQDFTVMRAALITYDRVLGLTFRQEHVNGWILPIRDSVWSADGVVDVTARLRRIQEEEERPTTGSIVP